MQPEQERELERQTRPTRWKLSAVLVKCPHEPGHCCLASNYHPNKWQASQLDFTKRNFDFDWHAVFPKFPKCCDSVIGSAALESCVFPSLLLQFFFRFPEAEREKPPGPSTAATSCYRGSVCRAACRTCSRMKQNAGARQLLGFWDI